jgi:hypothetical protein
MATAYSEIARVLDGARRRQGRIVLGTAVGAGLAGALAALLLGALLLGKGLGPPGGVRWAVLALAALAVVAAFAWAAVEVMRRASTHVAVAKSVGDRAPRLKSDLLSSVELEEERAEPGAAGRYSAALVEAHAAHTAGRARGLDLAAAVPSLPFRRATVVLGLAAAANLAALAVAPAVVKAGWNSLLGAAGAAPVRRTEPITGDIELTYVYPAYMRRAPKTLSGTGGEISAPKGTEVQLATRADRKVESAEIAIEGAAGLGPSNPGSPGEPYAQGERSGPAGGSPVRAEPFVSGAPRLRSGPAESKHAQRTYQLDVKDGRALAGRFVVEDGGSYRFRFIKGKKVLAEGPPLAIVVEPDAFPEVRITAPAQEIEVEAAARVRVEWTASDDVGLGDLTLVVKPPEGEERRTPVRALGGLKRESGVLDLDLAPYRLAEGEKLLYWLEVADEDTVSGPKKSASATQTVKVYSESEHRRAALAKAQQLWEEMVRLLGDRLEFLDGAPRWSEERLTQAGQLDARARGLHEGLRTAAQELRRERAVPKELAQALANVAGDVRNAEANVTSLRLQLQRMLRFQGPNSPLVRRMAEVDGDLDRALENGVLYLEQLFDKQRADDLVRMARDLAARRRDLANLLEKYKQAPSEEKKKELLAEVQRMKARMQDMMRRMAELAKGLQDEHMNQEALQELARGKDAMGGLDEIEKMLAKGDVEGAMKALDQLGNQMQDMLASLEKNAGTPGKQNAELMKEMLAFKKNLEDVQAEQEEVARETESVKADYKKALSERMKSLDAQAKKLEGMAAQAREELKKAEKGVTLRSEEDYAQARDRLADLEKALQGKDFDAALETARRSMAPMQRLAMGLEDEAAIADRYRQLRQKDPADVRDAQKHAQAALGPARKVKDELERMFPDPRSVLGDKQQQKLGQLSKRQGDLERKAGELRQKLDELAKRAPVFPPQAGEMLQGSQGHMREAQGQLSMRNPQRGHGEQRLALDDLARFRRGLEEMAKKSQGGGPGGQGFPFPFGEDQGGREGDGMDPSQEKVEIPGAEAYKVPDEFRKDLLEAMKQGTPEPYQGEVQHYYEELVK